LVFQIHFRKSQKRETRILALAFELWSEDGRPDGKPEKYLNAAREIFMVQESLAFFRWPDWLKFNRRLAYSAPPQALTEPELLEEQLPEPHQITLAQCA